MKLLVKIVIPEVSDEVSGLLTSEDKIKLDSIENSATKVEVKDEEKRKTYISNTKYQISYGDNLIIDSFENINQLRNNLISNSETIESYLIEYGKIFFLFDLNNYQI